MRQLLLVIACLLCAPSAHARAPCFIGEDVPYRIPIAGVVFVGFLDSQCFGLYKDGFLLRYDRKDFFSGWMSSGVPGKETPITLPSMGPHKIAHKVRLHFSSKVSVYVRGRKVRAAMPYTWFFNGDHALHEGNPRQPRASHGCVRLPKWAAKALFYRFRQDELRVVISPNMRDLLRRWK